ncbi:MAG: chaperone modulator CbpM [Bacteroidia bacterium]|nr:chaperone modulator CbpM [Bacteroidia bacterium]
MKTENLIPVEEFITHHKIELSFIYSLRESGLIEIIIVEHTQYISREQISELEKMIRLYYELDINVEGIEAIAHLVKRVDNLHQELTALKNRLKLYESD